MATGNHSILVIGYGEVGHAMEYLLGTQHVLQFWDIRPVAGHDTVALEQATADAEFLIFSVPVSPLEELARRVLPHLQEGSISFTVAKGLDAQGRPAPAIFSEVYADTHDYAVRYGPMIAEEIMQGRPAGGVTSIGIRAGRQEHLHGLSPVSSGSLVQWGPM